MIKELLDDAQIRMDKSVDATKHEMATVRTGRAAPALLDRVSVDYFGVPTPLQQMATVSASEARLLTIQPYDKSTLKSIEKAIMESDLGLTPSNDGNVVRLTLPELTEERRKELVKVVRHIVEEGRIAIRNVRRETMHNLKELRTGGEVSEDDERRAEGELQKLTDSKISKLEDQLKLKEQEILEV